MMKIPTLADVAERSGVSTATVSRALNAPEKVSKPTRELIQRVVRELDYSPNLGARALVANRSYAVGVIVPTIEKTAFAMFIQALQEELAADEVALLVAASGDDSRRERALVRSFVSRGVDGVVLVGDGRDEEIYELMRRRNAPFVVGWTSNPGSGFATVGFDDGVALRRLTEQVLSLGHTRIAVIALAAANKRTSGTAATVAAVAATRGLSIDVAQSSGSICDAEAIAKRLLTEPARPTALICGDDAVAAGALNAARRIGLSVPHDVSVVGFDDLDYARCLPTPLTTVKTPIRQMGRAAARLLLQPRTTGAPPERVVLNAEFVERGSLGPVPA